MNKHINSVIFSVAVQCLALSAHANPNSDGSLTAEVDASSRAVPTTAHGVTGRIKLTQVSLINSEVASVDGRLTPAICAEVHRQLQYLVGNLHGIEGGLRFMTP